MKKLLILATISCIFSQANYQILSTESNFKDIFEIGEFYDNYNYSVFNSSFPNDINLFTFTLSLKENKNYNFWVTLKNLDYGEFSDNNNDYTFKARESLIQFSLSKKNTILDKLMININYLRSTIDKYHSEAIGIDLLTLLKITDNHYLNIGLKNYGKIIKSYSNAVIDLPKSLNVSFHYKRAESPFSLISSYNKRIDTKENFIQITLGLKLNEKLMLYLSDRSNKSDLFFGDYIDKIISGTNIGLSYVKNENVLSIALQNLGAAGYVTSLSFTKTL